MFKAHDAPTEIPEHVLDLGEAHGGRIRVANVLRQAGLVGSNKEGTRSIQQGGVKLDGEVVTDPDLALTPDELDGVTLNLGKRRWIRVRLP